MDEDDLSDAHRDRMELAYEALTDIQATTVAGLLCQIRAWWNFHADVREQEVPKPDPEKYDYDAEVIVRRLYHDLERIAGETTS
jgi:hypothetical protein